MISMGLANQTEMSDHLPQSNIAPLSSVSGAIINSSSEEVGSSEHLPRNGLSVQQTREL